MRKLPFLLAVATAVLITGRANAQLEPGSLAPDWTYTDINNQSHHLYDYLDSGYVVVIDVSATWCAPCWNFHNSHIGKTLTDKYGPNGTVSPKKIKYFFIEADALTTMADLQGNTSATKGNWLAGVNYPVIDNAAIRKPYYVNGFPTFFVICPDKRVIFSSVSAIAAMATESFYTAFFNSCPKATTGTDAALISPDSTTDLCKNTVLLQNMSSQPLTSANIKVYDGGTLVATQPWTGSLPTFGVTGITLTATAGVTGAGNLRFKAEAVSDVNPANDTLSTGYSITTIPSGKIRIEVLTDQFAGENSWRLLNAGQLVAEVQYLYADAKKTFTYDYNVGQGACLHFELYDGSGDGLISGTNSTTADDGHIKFYDGANNTLLNTITAKSFSRQVSRNFRTPGTPQGIAQMIPDDALTIYPNPASDIVQLNLQLRTAGTASIKLSDMTGRIVYNIDVATDTKGALNKEIPVNNIAPGIYLLTVKANGAVLSRQLSIVR